MRQDYRSCLKFFKLLVQNGRNSLPPLKGEVFYTKKLRDDINPIFGDLVFTTDQGLFKIYNSSLVQLLKGKFYGITMFKDWIILSRSNNFTSTSDKNDKSRRQSDIIAFTNVEKKEYLEILNYFRNDDCLKELLNDFGYLTGSGEIAVMEEKNLRIFRCN